MQQYKKVLKKHSCPYCKDYIFLKQSNIYTTIQKIRLDWYIATHTDKSGKIWQGIADTEEKAKDNLLDNILKNNENI